RERQGDEREYGEKSAECSNIKAALRYALLECLDVIDREFRIDGLNFTTENFAQCRGRHMCARNYEYLTLRCPCDREIEQRREIGGHGDIVLNVWDDSDHSHPKFGRASVYNA